MPVTIITKQSRIIIRLAALRPCLRQKQALGYVQNAKKGSEPFSSYTITEAQRMHTKSDSSAQTNLIIGRHHRLLP